MTSVLDEMAELRRYLVARGDYEGLELLWQAIERLDSSPETDRTPGR